MRITFSLAVVAMFIIITSCAKSSLIGEELLGDEKSDIVFKDDFSLNLRSVVDDSVLIFPLNIDRRADILLLGNLDDPIFGKSSSVIYTQLGLDFTSNALPLLSLIADDIDSIVLQLTLDTTGFYGDPTASFDIEVRQILEPIDEADGFRLYADQSFLAEETKVLGDEFGLIPMPFDSVYTSDSSALEIPHLRVKLTKSALNAFRTDSIKLLNQDSLNAAFNGIQIEVTSNNNSMIGVNMFGVSGVKVYYKINDSLQTNYLFNFDIGAVKTSHIQHDYTGAFVEQFIALPELSDSLLFVQSQVGINTIIGFEDIDALGNIQINNAELELYAVTLPEDNSEWYPPIEQLISYQDNMEGSRSYGEDVRLALTENLLSVIFDGVISAPLAEDPNVRKYSMRVTAQMQDILNGETENLIIGSFFKAFSAQRVVLYGKDHPKYAPRLKLTYTKV